MFRNSHKKSSNSVGEWCSNYWLRFERDRFNIGIFTMASTSFTAQNLLSQSHTSLKRFKEYKEIRVTADVS